VTEGYDSAKFLQKLPTPIFVAVDNGVMESTLLLRNPGRLIL